MHADAEKMNYSCGGRTYQEWIEASRSLNSDVLEQIEKVITWTGRSDLIFVELIFVLRI